MQFIEKFSGIFFIAGLVLLLTAMLSLGIVPSLMVDKVHPRQGLPEVIPEDFKQYYSLPQDYQTALLRGRDIYVKEACWHCHSQFVRPVSNEALMYGPVNTPGEYQNALNMPQLFGTRRVGPDLSRQAGRHTNDWHFAHLYRPTNVVPQSVMPEYPWYFSMEEGVPKPKPDAVALVAYLQWLGTSVAHRTQTQYDIDQLTLPPESD